MNNDLLEVLDVVAGIETEFASNNLEGPITRISRYTRPARKSAREMAYIELGRRLQAGTCRAKVLDGDTLVDVPKNVWKDDADQYIARGCAPLHPGRLFIVDKGVSNYTAGAERRCEDWLERGFADGTLKGVPKAHILDGAKKEIPNLSDKAFKRAWAKKAPKDARRSGPKARSGIYE